MTERKESGSKIQQTKHCLHPKMSAANALETDIKELTPTYLQDPTKTP